VASHLPNIESALAGATFELMPSYAAATGVPWRTINAYALLRLLPGILALRHQLAVQRQLGEQRVRFEPADRGMAGRAVAPPAEAPALRWEFLDLTDEDSGVVVVG
jgi:hypothetical protein